MTKGTGDFHVKRKSDTEGRILTLLSFAPEGFRFKDILTHTGLSRRSAWKSLNKMKREGKIKRKMGAWLESPAVTSFTVYFDKEKPHSDRFIRQKSFPRIQGVRNLKDLKDLRKRAGRFSSKIPVYVLKQYH